jgi:hypothetical protein
MKDLKVFIIEEYKTAIQLTYHIDLLRNKVTSFFLIFAGVVTGLMLSVFENKANSNFFDIDLTIGLVCCYVAIIGVIVILILAKLRRVQLEHFKIINNIRDFQKEDEVNPESRLRISNMLILNSDTLPNARLFSGTYYWLLLIIITGAVITGLGMYYLADRNYCLSIISSIVYFIFTHWLYFKMAKY